MFHIALPCAHTIHADCGIKNPGNKNVYRRQARGIPLLAEQSSAIPQQLLARRLCRPGRSGRAGSAMWRQREHRGPEPGGENGAREQTPPPGRALQAASSVHLHTRYQDLSPALLAPADTRRLQLAPALPPLRERSPLPLAAASLGQAAILPLPLATAITRSAASAAPRLAGPRLPPARGVPSPPPPPPPTPQQQRS